MVFQNIVRILHGVDSEIKLQMAKHFLLQMEVDIFAFAETIT